MPLRYASVSAGADRIGLLLVLLLIGGGGMCSCSRIAETSVLGYAMYYLIRPAVEASAYRSDSGRTD